MLIADIDGNQRIDYQEFMKHFKDTLFLVKFHAELQALYDEELSSVNLTSQEGIGRLLLLLQALTLKS